MHTVKETLLINCFCDLVEIRTDNRVMDGNNVVEPLDETDMNAIVEAFRTLESPAFRAPTDTNTAKINTKHNFNERPPTIILCVTPGNEKVSFDVCTIGGQKSQLIDLLLELERIDGFRCTKNVVDVTTITFPLHMHDIVVAQMTHIGKCNVVTSRSVLVLCPRTSNVLRVCSRYDIMIE